MTSDKRIMFSHAGKFEIKTRQMIISKGIKHILKKLPSSSSLAGKEHLVNASHNRNNLLSEWTTKTGWSSSNQPGKVFIDNTLNSAVFLMVFLDIWTLIIELLYSNYFQSPKFCSSSTRANSFSL